jgi:TPP-dependent pyruvate/acetoin dehydrogenase alpha subunit
MERPDDLKLYRKMIEIRFFEERAVELYLQGELPGFLHSSIGQEAVPVGICAALKEKDYIISTHRGHGDIIAKGADLRKMFAELFGKRTGYCKGKGGSMHIADLDLGILGAVGVVGSCIPIATGAALAFRMNRTDQVVACFFGDGASDTGAFHEGLNMASTWSLPVVFVCQNNCFALSTPQCMHQRIEDISVRGTAYGIPGVTVDGMDVLTVRAEGEKAVARARRGEGPTLIECKTYRYLGHFVGEPGTDYRTKEEVESWKKKDAIDRFRAYLLEKKMADEPTLVQMEEKVRAAVEDAIRYGRESENPSPEEALEDIYVL